MTNYPPGVSGNEPQIAGYPEKQTIRTCGAVDVEVRIMPDDLDTWINAMSKMLEHTVTEASIRSYATGIVSVYKSLEYKTFITECLFKGDVDVQMHPYAEYWQCPLCGTEHETEHDIPEPPDYYD